MTHKGTQTLITNRLVLRRFRLGDVDAVYENWASDPVVTQYLSWEPHTDKTVTKSILTMWVEQYENPGVYHWGIEFEGVLVGAISVVLASDANQHAEIGYCLGHAYWGKGIMTEALGAVIRFLFVEIGLNRVYLKHDTENPGSGKVMRKNGLKLEGILRGHHRRKDGSFGDLAIYGILREQWMVSLDLLRDC